MEDSPVLIVFLWKLVCLHRCRVTIGDLVHLILIWHFSEVNDFKKSSKSSTSITNVNKNIFKIKCESDSKTQIILFLRKNKKNGYKNVMDRRKWMWRNDRFERTARKARGHWFGWLDSFIQYLQRHEWSNSALPQVILFEKELW